MKVLKRITAAATALAALTGILPLTTFAEEEPVASIPESPTSTVDTDYAMEATDSFGDLLVNAVEEETAPETDYASNVVGIEIEGNLATVEYSSVEDCTLIVGIYDENAQQLLASGSTEIYAAEESAQVTIETDAMPTYFYTMAYLVDTETMRPVSSVYESSWYTQDMQELLASTVEDYDPELVLNLDEDNTNNFAVFREETVQLSAETDTNILTQADEENETYVIENADETVTSLQPGDVFTYPQEDGMLLIVSVVGITVDGTTVSITGDPDVDLEDVFDYVKIDTESGLGGAEIDESAASEGVTYLGMTDMGSAEASDVEETEAAVTDTPENVVGAWDNGNGDTFSTGISLSISTGRISGGLSFSLGLSFKYYISLKKVYFETTITNQVELSVKAEAKLTEEIDIPGILIPTSLVGVHFVVYPQFTFEVGGEISFGATFKTVSGFRMTQKPENRISVKSRNYPRV